MKTQKLRQRCFFIIKVELISQFALVYLLLTSSMLLLNRICLIAQVFRLFHIPHDTGRKLNLHKSYKL